MAKRALLAALLVFAGGALVFLLPFATQTREATALTAAVPPLPPGSLVPAAIKPGSELCIRDLPFSPDGEVARVQTATGGRPGPAFELRAQAPGYETRSQVRAGWKEGALEIPLQPPPRAGRGTLCFRNTGTAELTLLASGVGQKLARPTPYLDGQALQQDVPLVFRKAKPASMTSRFGELIDHAAVFSPLPAWALWLLLACVLVALPVAAVAGVVAASRLDAEPVAPDALSRAGNPATSPRARC